MILRLLTTVMLVLATGLAGCAETSDPGNGIDGEDDPTQSPGASPGGAVEVSIDGLAFADQEITVPAGASVRWVNNDSVGHTVTHGQDGQPASDAMFDEAIGVGEEVSITFDEPGTYQVTCTIHPQMNMTVVVEE